MKNALLKSKLSAHQMAVLQSEFDKKKKSKTVALLLWWFGCVFGLQRFYTGDTGKAVALIFIGPLTLWIWNLVDGFLVLKRIEELNEGIELALIAQLTAGE